MTEQKEQQKSTDQNHMFPSVPEHINYIENKLCHSDDIKKLDFPFQNGKGTILYIESLADLNLIHQLALEPLLTRSDLSLDKAFATLSMK
ncbi:spore germination protein, partial [Bacillus sp. 'calajunan']